MTTKKSKLVPLFLLAIICLTITSCGSSENEIKTNGLVGTWVSEQLQITKKENDVITFNEVYQTQDFVIRFDADAKGDYFQTPPMPKGPFPFTYTNSTLTFTGLNNLHRHDIMTVSEIGANSLALRYEKPLVDEEYKEVWLFTFHRKK